MNVVSIYGKSQSKCGYCKGDRVAIINAANADKATSTESVMESGGESGGESKVPKTSSESTPSNPSNPSNPTKSSSSYGCIFSALTPAAYQSMIDRGWRRSGTYCYLPDNSTSCCPAHTIRLNVADFRISKSQKKVWTRFFKLLKPRTATPEPPSKSANAVHPELPELLSRISRALCSTLLSSSISPLILSIVSETELKQLSTTRPNPKDGSLLSTALCCALVGRSSHSITLQKLHAVIKATLPPPSDLSGDSTLIVESVDFAQSGHINFRLSEAPQTAPQTPPRAEQLATTTPSPLAVALGFDDLAPLAFTATMVPSTVSAKDPAVHRLYAMYQAPAHRDANPYVGMAAGASPTELTTPPPPPSAEQKQLDKDYKGFTRFLCVSPLKPKQPEDGKTYDKDEDGYDVAVDCGTYHLQYRVNNVLIAVGVLDVLPNCLSSVYCFYNPELSGGVCRLNLGKFTALYEIEWIKRARKLREELSYYYLGFYIHSCVKMKYKSEYSPSTIRCSETNEFVPYEEAKVLLDASREKHHCRFARSLSGEEKEKERKKRAVEKMVVEDLVEMTKFDISRAGGGGSSEEEEEGGRQVQLVLLGQITPHGQKIIRPLMQEFFQNIGLETSTVGSPYGSQTSPNQRLSQLGSTSLVSANSDTYSSSKRLVAARETEIIMRARASQRESVKGKMLSEQELFRKKKFITKQMKTDIAVAKTTRSPFLVDLLAENERIDEENVVRLTEQAKRMRIFESRKEEAKNQIILRALQEASDLDALRKEKRIIMEEERRLKALLDIEKTKAHRKADRMAAARAERQRKSNKAEYRRAGNKEMLDDHRRREDNLLKLKHEVKAKPDNTFSTYNF